MRFLYLTFVFFITLSCSQEKDREVLPGSSVINKEEKTDTISFTSKKVNQFNIDTALLNESLTSDSINLDLFVSGIQKNKKFLDRFANDSSLQMTFKHLNKPQIELSIHFFSDSSKGKNAFFNWLDEVKLSKVGSSLSLSKKNSIFILTEKHFQTITSSYPLDITKALRIFRFFSKNERLIYFMKSNRKETIWYTFEKDKLIKSQNEASK